MCGGRLGIEGVLFSLCWGDASLFPSFLRHSWEVVKFNSIQFSVIMGTMLLLV